MAESRHHNFAKRKKGEFSTMCQRDVLYLEVLFLSPRPSPSHPRTSTSFRKHQQGISTCLAGFYGMSPVRSLLRPLMLMKEGLSTTKSSLFGDHEEEQDDMYKLLQEPRHCLGIIARS